MSTKVLLVAGATGKQGGSVIEQLLASSSASDYTILGVTRDANSASAKKLASKSPLIKIVQGNFEDVPALFKSASAITGSQPVWGVFSVQVPGGKGQSTETEEKYGKALVDEAVKQGVKHFVYTSVERGGDEVSWNNPTDVPHFISKHRVEHHLRDNASTMGWTILRPVAFMDNFMPSFGTKVFLTALKDTLGEKRLQFVSVADIGWFGAQALLKPEEWNHKAIGIAGDELNYEELEQKFENATGQRVGTTFSFLGSALMWGVADVGQMLRWFKTDGYGVDVKRLRQINPSLADMETWIRKSPWQKK